MDDPKILFYDNPGINPHTGRKIKIQGPTYWKLVEEFGPPPTPKQLPSPISPALFQQLITNLVPRINISPGQFGKSIRQEELGRGAYGFVTKESLSDGTLVAIKHFLVVHGDGLEKSTLREINSLQLLINCPFVLQILDVNIIPKLLTSEVMVMYHSGDLRTFQTTVDFPERLRVFPEILLSMFIALKALRFRGILHRDIKSANILVEYQYDSQLKKLIGPVTAYLADFGLSYISCSLDHKTEYKSVYMYTPIYRPPEMLIDNHFYNEKADLWALGVSMLELLMGRYMLDIDPGKSYGNRQLLNEIYSISEYSDMSELLLPPAELLPVNIDITRLLMRTVDPDYYHTISDEIINVLISILQIRPEQRLDIDVYTENVTIPQPALKMLTIKPMEDPAYILNYYSLVDYMIDLAVSLKLGVKTVINAIDLLERYGTNYQVYLDTLVLLGIMCVRVSEKMIEDGVHGIYAYLYVTGNKYAREDILGYEVYFVELFDYMLVSCEIDPIVKRIGELNLSLGDIKSKYIEKKNSGLSSYKDILNL